MRILVTGAEGQLGQEVLLEGHRQMFDMIGAGRREMDITDLQQVDQYVRMQKPDIIIHCAAYTAVDQAEEERDACWNVNVLGTRHLAEAAREAGAVLLYVSTDYVFEGAGQEPYVETDIPHPINYYGLTKWGGEQAIQALLDKWFIVRVSWVFGKYGQNFVKSMLQLAESRDEISVVEDQIGSPTYTVDLARLLLHMISTDKYGVYHATNEGYCSWAELAEEVFRQAGIDVKVSGIPSQAYPTKARRPHNSRLSKKKLRAAGFEPLPQWQEAVARCLEKNS